MRTGQPTVARPATPACGGVGTVKYVAWRITLLIFNSRRRLTIGAVIDPPHLVLALGVSRHPYSEIADLYCAHPVHAATAGPASRATTTCPATAICAQG